MQNPNYPHLEDYILGRDENGKTVMDLGALSEALNSTGTCNVVNCMTTVAGRGMCMPCFMATMLDKTVWLESRAGFVNLQKEYRYYVSS